MEMTEEGKTTLAQLQTAAKSALDGSKGANRSLYNGIAAILCEQSKVMSHVGYLGQDDPENSEESSESVGPSSLTSCAVKEAHATTKIYKEGARKQGTACSITLQENSLPSVATARGISQHIFPSNIAKPVARTELPSLGARVVDTAQLAYGLTLINNPPAMHPLRSHLPGGHPFGSPEAIWISAIHQDSTEQQRLEWLSTRVVEEFLNDGIKRSVSIHEIVFLAPTLDDELFRKLLNCFIGEFDAATILDKDMLQGLVQLVDCAQPGYLCSDDLITILGSLRKRLESTHLQSSDHAYYLTLAVSQVLDVMARHEVRNISRVQEHEPLSAVLSGLHGSSDPFLMYQASYAFQALQYVPDNETALQAVLRHSAGFAQGVIQVTGVVNLDLNGFLKGLKQLQKTIGTTVGITMTAFKGMCTLVEEGRGVLNALRDGLGSGYKRAWYPGVIAAKALADDGRLADLRRVVSEAVCRQDPAFQWGICQLLGEIALDPIWEVDTRQQAVDFLVELYRDDAEWGLDVSVKAWNLTVLRVISEDADQLVKDRSVVFLRNLEIDNDAGLARAYPVMSHLPAPSSSPLLMRAQSISPVDDDLHRLKNMRLNDLPPLVYIFPQAKAALHKSDDGSRPLIDKVKEFLVSDRQVFLLLGDSGSGKSVFNRHLERDLWTNYQLGDPIPLLISLPTIENPGEEMIEKQLRRLNFPQESIQELKQHRRFIIICDGYDESRLSVNLHLANAFNQPGQWNTKMIVSCRSTHVGQDYHDRFRPMFNDRYNMNSATTDLFEEATIAPFSTYQVRKYVEQHVQDPEVQKLFRGSPVWTADEYMYNLTQIPNLLQLVANPFLLAMALRALPVVVKGELDLSSVKITRLQLYETFINQWLEVNKQRLTSSFQSTDTAEALEELLEEGFILAVIDYSKNLAAAMYNHQRGNPVVRYSHRSDKATWKAQFFGPAADITLLRESTPLTRAGSLHRFIHRSLLEYFYFRHISEHAFEYEAVDMKFYKTYVRQPSFTIRMRDTTERIRRFFIGIFNPPQQLSDHPLKNVDLTREPEILQFLVDHMQEESQYGSRLQEIVDHAVSHKGQITEAVRNARRILGQPEFTFEEELSFFDLGL